MVYADVALATRRGGRETILTYQIPAELLLALKPGVVVEVPYRTDRVDGIVVELRRTLPRAHLRSRLRPIGRVLSPWPLLSTQELQFRRNLAEHSAQPLGLVLTQALPPHSLYRQLEVPAIPLSQPQTERIFWLGNRSTDLTGLANHIRRTIQAGLSVLLVAPTKAQILVWQTQLNRQVAEIQSVIFDPQAPVDQQRRVWEIVLGNQTGIVMATQSVVWLPFRRLGLVAIDEPTDHSYESEQAPYLPAFDILRARQAMQGFSLIAFDSLPPYELLIRPERTRWQIRQLTQVQPKLHLIHRSPAERLATTSQKALEQIVESGGRALIVVPQSGWGSGLVCRQCEYLFRCPTCDHVIKVTTGGQELICWFCRTTSAVPSTCPRCQGPHLTSFGWGGERWHDYLASLFSSAKVVELNQSAPTSDWQIGITHPVWHNLPSVEADLVIAIEPERLLVANQFRATELWLRLLWKIRHQAKKQLIIETMLPTDPIFQELLKPLPTQTINGELRRRQTGLYPPFGRMLRIDLIKISPARLETIQAELAAALKKLLPAARIFEPILIEGKGQSTWQISIHLPIATSAKQLTSLAALLPPKTKLVLHDH